MKKLMTIMKNAVKYYFTTNTIIYINCIAFSLLVSLAPMTALLTIFSLRFLQTEIWLQNELASIIPENIVDTFINVGLETDSLGFIPFITAIILTILVASRGFYALMLTFAELEEAHSKVLTMNLISLIAPFAFSLFTIILIGTISAIQIFIPGSLVILNWLISFVVSYLLCLSFYYITNYPRERVRDFIYGSVVMAIGLTLMSNFFMVIIDQFFNYNDVYGSLAYLLILFLAIVWVSMIIYFGHCVNVAVGRYNDEKYNKQ